MDPAAYQDGRQGLLSSLEKLRELREELAFKEPAFVNSLPVDAQQKLQHIDRDISRLRNPNLTIAFVGGFSAGKSSLVNAFLGRYLLPESTKVTTAVPTFVRSGSEEEAAELHYLNEAEVRDLGELYRREIAQVFRVPDLAGAPAAELMGAVRAMAQEGRGKRLVEQFELYLDETKRRGFDPRGQVLPCRIQDAQDVIRNEREAMFLDRVELRIANHDLPEDIVLVDLPGVSVPNPRHRDVTFRFVAREAHAVVFVFMANKLFDKDEIEIVEQIRAGEARIADKTFWVLNRWDALSPQHQRETIADFEAKMSEFAIPRDYVSFRTNALHGLLAQLCLRDETLTDPAIQEHLKDYDDLLERRYGSSHAVALAESQIPRLQEQVLRFLNDRLRETTLQSALANTRANFAVPLLHHLRKGKEADDALVDGELRRREKEAVRARVEGLSELRTTELRQTFRSLRDDVVRDQASILLEHARDLIEQLQAQIRDGSETDAYEIYKRILADQDLRKFPYYFEIEMRIVDNLNTMLKRSFRAIVQRQVGAVFEKLLSRVNNVLEQVGADVGYDPKVTTALEEIVRGTEDSFRNKVDGVVMEKAAHLDELLLYKPKGFFGFFSSGNEIIDGLERAARMGSDRIHSTTQAIQEEDMRGKTRLIRATLSEHYIDKAGQFHEQVAETVWVIVINIMLEMERRMLDQLRTRYASALEAIQAKEAEREFLQERDGIENRSRYYREVIERIEDQVQIMSRLVETARGRADSRQEPARAT